MDKDKEIASLRKQAWWREKQFKARESYLLYKIERLEEQLKKDGK